MWRAVDDIKKILNIDIDVVTIDTLILLVWNGINLKECREPFFNNKTKNRNISMLYKVDTSFLDTGYLSILDTKNKYIIFTFILFQNIRRILRNKLTEFLCG